MTTTVQVERGVLPWPLARRVMSGLARPGGAAMMERVLEGLGLGEGDRVVELAPGLGTGSTALLARNPRSWVGVEPDDLAAGHLRRAIAGPGREVVETPLDATGLDDDSASAVVSDGVLSTLSADERAAVLAEGARLLRAGGRLALHEMTPSGDGEYGDAARAAFEGAGLHPLEVHQWRAVLEAAGLVVVGSLVGPLDLSAPHELMRDAGPRTALRITRQTATDAAARAGGMAAREALTRYALALRSVIVVAEKPLILGMRRPRR